MTVGAPPPVSGTDLQQIKISAAASEAIDAWAWGLQTGTLRLWQLPDSINTLWNLAFEQGRASRESEVRELRLETDRYWLRAFVDKDRQEYLLARLDQAAVLASRPDVDDVLDEAWRIYLASLDNLREPIGLNTTEDTTGSSNDRTA